MHGLINRSLLACLLVASCHCAIAAEPATPRLFPPSELGTSSGGLLSKTNFMSADDCGSCHTRHFEQWKGSMHSQAHRDPLYLAFAELARKEGGDELYVFCSSCHAPGAVATGEIPGKPGAKASFLIEEGVTCDACHKAAAVKPVHKGMGGANASLVLDASENRYGPLLDAEVNDAHPSVASDIYTNAVLCSACHTLVHPHNGIVIENTFEEWRGGPFAGAGISCQECHMRPVANAVQTALTMKKTPMPGKAVDEGPDRPDVYEHMFVGANAMGAQVGAGEKHTAAAIERLKSAAAITVEAPASARAGSTFQLALVVSNVAAGHAIPSSITELRQVWLDIRVEDALGQELFRRGAIDGTGRVDTNAVVYRSVLGDKDGRVTYLPWRAERILEEKLIPPRGAVRETMSVAIPAGAKLPVRIKATLCYRSAPQDVVDELFGKGRFTIPTIPMAAAEIMVPAP